MPKPVQNWQALTDEMLVEACKNGQDVAFQELMNRYIEPIFNFARQYVRNKEDAEDITQESFFKAWKNIGRFTKGRTFRPWLYTIARNTALDHIKKRHASPFSELDDEENELSYAETLADTEPLPLELFQQKEAANRLSELMSDLHPDHKAVLHMHYNQEMTFEEIAGALEKPMNTVKSWHRRALIRMRQKLNEHDLTLHHRGE